MRRSGLGVLLAHPLAGAATDSSGNVGPMPQLSGGSYPLLNHSLDQHFDGVALSPTGEVDVSGVPPLIAYFFASILWLATSFLANLLITLFGFAGGQGRTGLEAAPQATREAAHLAIPALARIAGDRHPERLSATAIVPSSPRHQWVSP